MAWPVGLYRIDSFFFFINIIFLSYIYTLIHNLLVILDWCLFNIIAAIILAKIYCIILQACIYNMAIY